MSGAKDGGRTDDFKRATAGTLRAMAQKADVQVAFQPGPSGLAGKRARLPLPTRALPPAEMSRLRGAADSVALRLRHHDTDVHASRSPGRREAKDVYDALEQARVEVVGAQHMTGVAANLRARLNEECEAEGYDRMTRRDQLPLPAALSLLARERMSGEDAPDAARRVLDYWRDTLGPGAEQALDEMAARRDDQTAFARAARKLLAALDLAEARSRHSPTSSPTRRRKATSREARTTRSRARRNPSRRPRPCSARNPSRSRARPPRTTARTRRRTPRRPRATSARAGRSSAVRSPWPTTAHPTAPTAGRRTRRPKLRIFVIRTS